MLGAISKHFKFMETHAGFYLGFLNGGGESILKELFRPSKGIRGHASPVNFEKIVFNVQDWLKSYFWTAVTFTDVSISSSDKISI